MSSTCCSFIIRKCNLKLASSFRSVRVAMSLLWATKSECYKCDFNNYKLKVKAEKQDDARRALQVARTLKTD